MKNFVSIIIILALILSTGCKTTLSIKAPNNRIKAPPGQVKKVTGTKSAKPFAPGQQKKKTKKKNYEIH